MRLKERLDEIATQLGAPPRTVKITMEEWFERVENHWGTRSWPTRESQLIEEWRQLRRDYELAKAKP